MSELNLNEEQQELLNAFSSAIQLANSFLKRCPDTKAKFRCEGKLEEAIYWMLHSSLAYKKPVEVPKEVLEQLQQQTKEALKKSEHEGLPLKQVEDVEEPAPQEAVA